MSGFGLLHSSVLLILLMLIPLSLFLIYSEKLRQKRRAFFQTAVVSSATLQLLTKLLLVTLLTVALARPHLGFEDVPVVQLGTDRVVVFDLSLSMLATDVAPSRLELAKRKLRDLVSLAERRGTSDRFGLVLFAGASYLYCPLTSDYRVLDTFIKKISDSLIADQGSAVGTALVSALRSIKAVKSESARILLLSDGESEGADLGPALSELQSAGVAVDVIGFGTPGGAPIETSKGRFLKDQRGEIVMTKLNENDLRKLAQSTGGRYRRAKLDDSDLEAVLIDRPADQAKPLEKSIRVYREIGPLLLLIPILVILASLLMRRPDLVFMVILFIHTTAHADDQNGTARDGYLAYSAGDFAKAEAILEKAYNNNPDDPKVLRALASAKYKLGKYAEAQELFAKELPTTKSGRSLFESLYNSGNALLQDKKYNEAIALYEQALKIKPDDHQAKFNLELARNLLQKQQEEQKQDPQKGKNQEQQEEQNKEQSEGQEEDKGEEQKKEQGQGQEREEEEKEKTQNKGKDEGGDQDEGEEQKQGQDQDQGQEREQEEAEGEPATQHDETSLKEAQAKAWLESLPESPVLLRHHVGESKGTRQPW